MQASAHTTWQPGKGTYSRAILLHTLLEHSISFPLVVALVNKYNLATFSDPVRLHAGFTKNLFHLVTTIVTRVILEEFYDLSKSSLKDFTLILAFSDLACIQKANKLITIGFFFINGEI